MNPTLYNERKATGLCRPICFGANDKDAVCGYRFARRIDKPHKGHYEVGCIDFIDIGELI